MKKNINSFFSAFFAVLFLYSCETISNVTDYVSSGFSSDDNENVEIVSRNDDTLDSDTENSKLIESEVQVTEKDLEKTKSVTKKEEKKKLETADEKLSPTPQQEYESSLISENSEKAVAQKTPNENVTNLSQTDEKPEKTVLNLELAPLNLVNKIQYRIATIAFRSGSSSVDAIGLKKIKKIVGIAKKRNAKVKIVGHASSRTKDMTITEHKLVNFRISDQRAQSVAKVFMQNKFPSERLITEAVSDAKPLFQENMPAGTYANQRTEIFLIY